MQANDACGSCNRDDSVRCFAVTDTLTRCLLCKDGNETVTVTVLA